MNNNQDVNKNGEIKLPLPSTAILNLSRKLRSRHSTNYSTQHKHEANDNNFTDINDQSGIIELFRCAETTNSTLSLCLNKTNIQKVTFKHRKEENGSITIRPTEKNAIVECPNTPLINKLIVISHLLLAINSSANVLIYMLKGMQYDKQIIYFA